MELVPNADAIETLFELPQANWYIEFTGDYAGDVCVGEESYWTEEAMYFTLSPANTYVNSWEGTGYPMYIQYTEDNASTDPVTVSYKAYLVLPTVVVAPEGTANVLNGANTSFFFSIEKPGFYKLSTSEETTFGEYLSLGYEITTSTGEYLLFETTKANQTVEIVVFYYDYYSTGYGRVIPILDSINEVK